MGRSTEKAESIEGLYEFLGQAERQPAEPLDIVCSTGTAMQNHVPRNQAVTSRNLKYYRLRVARVLRAMALGAHGRGVGGKCQPKLSAGDIYTSGIVCR